MFCRSSPCVSKSKSITVVSIKYRHCGIFLCQRIQFSVFRDKSRFYSLRNFIKNSMEEINTVMCIINFVIVSPTRSGDTMDSSSLSSAPSSTEISC